jgi:uncharacterized membrane protein
MAKKEMKKEDEKKLYAFLGVFLTVIGFIIVLATKKDDKYAMHYGKQGLILFFAWIVIWIFAMIPLIGWILMPLLWIAWLILWIIGIVYSFSGEMKNIPLIGQFADKIKI